MTDENIESLQRLSKESGIPSLVLLFTGIFAFGFLVLPPLDYLTNGPIGPEPEVEHPQFNDLTNPQKYLSQKAAHDSWASRKMFREVMWVSGPISLILICAYEIRSVRQAANKKKRRDHTDANVSSFLNSLGKKPESGQDDD